MRLRIAAFFAALTLLGTIAVAQTAIGYRQLTVSSTVQTIPSAIGAGATQCRGSLEQSQVRVAYDGSTPTSTSGQPMNVNDVLVLGNAQDIANFKSIAQNATSGLLNLTCSSGTPPTASFIQSAVIVTPSCNPLFRLANLCR